MRTASNGNITNTLKLVPILACALVACGSEQVGSPESIGSAQGALTATNLTVVLGSETNDEHCYVPASLLSTDPATNKFHPWEQLLIYRGTTLRGICTVDPAPSASSNIEMSPTGFSNRVASNQTEVNAGAATGVTVTNEYTAGVAPAIAMTASTISEVMTPTLNNNSVKSFMDRAPAAQVIYTAVHPFERYTLQQAQDIYNKNSSYVDNNARNAIWVVGINNNDYTGDSTKYHITASDISGGSFPHYGQLALNPLSYAVSFHRNDCGTADIRVGGKQPDSFRQGVAEILTEYLAGLSLSVTWASGGSCGYLDGQQDSNYVNNLAVGGYGLQIEEHYTVLNDATTRAKVNAAVRSVFDCLTEFPNGQTTIGNDPIYAFASNNSYFSDSECHRWRLEFRISGASAGTRTWNVGHSYCQAGDTAHVDFYKMGESGAPTTRLGGGNIQYNVDANYNCVPQKLAGFRAPTISGNGLFRVVIRATNFFGSTSGEAAAPWFSLSAP
jgi:hypothetical protein